MDSFAAALKSNNLLIGRSHRLRRSSSWGSKWNGGDVSCILPSITCFWSLVIKSENLNFKFWNHISSLNQYNKSQIFLEYGFDVNDNIKGKKFKM